MCYLVESAGVEVELADLVFEIGDQRSRLTGLKVAAAATVLVDQALTEPLAAMASVASTQGNPESPQLLA